MKSNAVRSLLATAVLLCGSLAHSGIVTWEYSGLINLADGGFAADIAAGDRFTGRFQTDDSAMGAQSVIDESDLAGLDPALIHPFFSGQSTRFEASQLGGGATALVKHTVTVSTMGGDLTFSSGDDALQVMRNVENEWLGLDDAPDSAFDSFVAFTLGQNFLDTFFLRLTTADSPNPLFPTDEFVFDPPDLADLFLGRFTLNLDLGGAGAADSHLRGYFDTLVRVPEPGSLGLVGLGLLLLVRLKFRR